MKPLFILDQKLTKTTWNHVFQKIKKALKAINVELEDSTILALIEFCTISCLRLEKLPKYASIFDDEIDSISRIISDLKINIKTLQQSKKIYMGGEEQNADSIITLTKKHIFNLKAKQALLLSRKKLIYSKHEIKTEAILKIFRVGNLLKLQESKLCAGRKNINQLYAFVEIITGISNRATLIKYHKLYKDSVSI